MVSWSNDKELLSGADVINCETLNKKKKKKRSTSHQVVEAI